MCDITYGISTSSFINLNIYIAFCSYTGAHGAQLDPDSTLILFQQTTGSGLVVFNIDDMTSSK